MASRAAKYQLRGEPRGDGSANQNMVLEFGARYARPLDDTTGLRIIHRTLGNGAGVLLERDDFTALSAWLAGGVEPYAVGGPPEGIDTLYFRRRAVTADVYTLRDLQTTAVLVRMGAASGGLAVRTYWNGSGRGSGVVLTGPQTDALRLWMAERLEQGWAGWHTPQTHPHA